MLARIPAVIRFISYEPAIGPIKRLDLGDGCVPDWVIFGGESGPKGRTARGEWARAILNECQRHGVAYFHKQWGTWASNPDPASDSERHGKGGGLPDGQLWRQFPEAQGIIRSRREKVA